MIEQINAIYENGGFRPVNLTEVPLSDGALVRLTVEPIPQDTGQSILELAAQVYAGLSEEDVSEVENIALDRTGFFTP
ncbi:antitoxin family protein [Bythopirellula polymerisocia]|uniref:DUF104 domain-containing protein n=1 Tax=Bythopirellula polymerisocia TaxID=2528003 RepID=A0A5C6D3F1_9BACT|nr:antitoxin family protein [Bythopirellula polymerisocia]TWU30311.1 hypothetical protein Pla144_10970 [Bythopirellula polymerisocia]